MKFAEHLQSCDLLFNPPLHNSVQIPAYSKKIAEHATTFEAWSDVTLVGLVAVYYNDYTSWRGFITSVSVVQDFQRCGVAGKLIQRTLEYGVEAGFKAIALQANVACKPAIALYRKYGFSISRTDGDKVTLEQNFGPVSHVI